MLGDSAVLGAGGGGVAATVTVTHDVATTTGGGGGGSNNSGDDERGRIEEGERSFGGNRWPRQETLALLRIRSDMDVAFRDASVKGPLWEEVSRKMAELGYHRSSKKCKEKFENVYKYHKRTKEGRSGKQDGKTYRFFDQLQALENHSPTPHSPNPSPKPPQSAPSRVVASSVSLPIATTTTVSLPIPTPTTVPMQPILSNNAILTSSVPNITVPSTTPLPITIPQPILTSPSINLTIPSYPPTNPTNFPPPPNPTLPSSFPTDTFSNSSSSSTSSEETLEGRRKRKRKWKDFFERLMKEVIEKQEELQKKFLEAIEKREDDRIAREEAWRVQEMKRINREREILAQERSIAAAKDAAVMSFLQKIAEQQNLGQVSTNINLVQQPQPQLQPQPPLQQQVTQPSIAAAQPPVQQPPPVVVTQPVVLPVVSQVTNMEIVKADNNSNNNNNGENFLAPSSSRWPKVEVQALIKLRTSMDEKYQENGPKGPLWEEISASMKKLGYNRNAKRCKEKWENINKYFKKVKESNKRRPEDSKTCPYFHQLDALYRQKHRGEESPAAVEAKPESAVAPLMVQPEQQWPPQQQQQDRDITMEDMENEDDEYEEEREGEEELEDDEDEEDEEGGGGGGNYEIVANKTSGGGGASAASVGASTE
ncbi:hypothetical protein AAZV13_10G187600 [Glycine max]